MTWTKNVQVIHNLLFFNMFNLDINLDIFVIVLLFDDLLA